MDCTKGTLSYIGSRGEKFMSYAYIQGQEAQALAYYKKLLEIEPDAKARAALTELVAKLQKIIDEKQPPASPSSEVVQNAVAA
jgi:Holliday junction resolvasome RuvABC endonuclease subunit